MLDLISLINSGGFVMWTLLALSLLIWSSIFYTYENYSLASSNFNQKIIFLKNYPTQNFDQAFLNLEKDMNLNERLIKSFVAVAPLLGLLGTVGGMIETFSSLQTMEMFKPSGGISQGISQALLTTQLGLIVAVPALLFLKILEKRKKVFLEELSEVVKKEGESSAI
jgi:biopolymer transport protein ExbB